MRIKINVPDGQVGKWEVQSFQLSKEDAAFHNLQESRGLKRYIKAGVPYKRLLRHGDQCYLNGYTVMSNTPAEIADLSPFLDQARGSVLIFGLGLGVVVQALMNKRDITSITVIEIDPDVIKLAGTHYLSVSRKLKIIEGDAFKYYDETKYDAIWFDIWDEISEENLKYG